MLTLIIVHILATAGVIFGLGNGAYLMALNENTVRYRKRAPFSHAPNVAFWSLGLACLTILIIL